MKKSNRLVACVVKIVIGVVLTICGAAGLLDSYWSGMGTALIVVGGLMLVRQLRYKTNTEYKEKVDVEINDERNKYLRIKAWSWAGYIFVMFGAFGSILFKIFGLDQYSQFSAYCVCLIMVLYWISYMVLRKKY